MISESSRDEVYQTNWFTYQAMDSFLGHNYDCKPTEDTEKETQQGVTTVQNPQDENTTQKQTQEQQVTLRQTSQEVMQSKQTVKTAEIQGKNKIPSECQVVKKNMDNAFQVMAEAAKRQDLDEADHSYQMLAKKFKKNG